VVGAPAGDAEQAGELRAQRRDLNRLVQVRGAHVQGRCLLGKAARKAVAAAHLATEQQRTAIARAPWGRHGHATPRAGL
jgi:hypothetical protein